MFGATEVLAYQPATDLGRVSFLRGHFKALHELQRLQAERQGEAVPLPEAVDVEVSMREPDELALLGRTSAVFPTDMNGDADDAPDQ